MFLRCIWLKFFLHAIRRYKIGEKYELLYVFPSAVLPYTFNNFLYGSYLKYSYSALRTSAFTASLLHSQSLPASFDDNRPITAKHRAASNVFKGNILC